VRQAHTAFYSTPSPQEWFTARAEAYAEPGIERDGWAVGGVNARECRRQTVTLTVSTVEEGGLPVQAAPRRRPR
jgi:hypothetical protein